MFDPQRFPDPPPELQLQVERHGDEVQLWDASPERVLFRSQPTFRMAIVFLRVWKAGVMAIGALGTIAVVVLAAAGAMQWGVAILVACVLLVGVTVMLRVGRIGPLRLRSIGGWFLTASAGVWQGAGGRVDPATIRGLTLLPGGGAIQAETDRRTVALVVGIAEPQASWLCETLRRELGLRS